MTDPATATPAPAVTDIADLGDAEATTKVDVIFSDDGEALSGFVVVGANSPQYQEATRKADVSSVRRSHLKGRPIDPKTEDGAATLVDAGMKREMAIACGCVVGMYGFTSAGAPVEPTPAILKDLFTKRPTWRKRVVAAVESDAGFTRR